MKPKFTITAVILILISIGAYYFPAFTTKGEVQKAAKIKADNNAFTQKALEEFNNNKNMKASEIAAKVMDELNEVAQNPYDKDTKPYSFEKERKGGTSVEADDSINMIIVTTYNRKGDLIARTVIKPPSFVTYSSKEED